MEFGVVEDLLVVVLSILLFGQQFSRFLGAVVFLADFSRGPEVALSYVFQRSPELLLQLGRVAKLKQGLNGLVIEEIDLLHRFLL